MSGFKIYPTWHLQMYESSLFIHMCWQSCPRAHGSAPEKRHVHMWYEISWHHSSGTWTSVSSWQSCPWALGIQFWKQKLLITSVKEHLWRVISSCCPNYTLGLFWHLYHIPTEKNLHLYHGIHLSRLTQTCWQSRSWVHVFKPEKRHYHS